MSMHVGSPLLSFMNCRRVFMAATASERLGSAFMTDLKCSTTTEEREIWKAKKPIRQEPG